MSNRDPGNHGDGQSCKLCGGWGYGGETCPHCGREPTAQQVMDARRIEEPHALLAQCKKAEARVRELEAEVKHQNGWAHELRGETERLRGVLDELLDALAASPKDRVRLHKLARVCPSGAALLPAPTDEDKP